MTLNMSAAPTDICVSQAVVRLAWCHLVLHLSLPWKQLALALQQPFRPSFWWQASTLDEVTNSDGLDIPQMAQVEQPALLLDLEVAVAPGSQMEQGTAMLVTNMGALK